MKARPAVALTLAVTVCLAILAPLAYRFLRGPDASVPEATVASLTDLLKVITGGLIGWLARPDEAA